MAYAFSVMSRMSLETLTVPQLQASKWAKSARKSLQLDDGLAVFTERPAAGIGRGERKEFFDESLT